MCHAYERERLGIAEHIVSLPVRLEDTDWRVRHQHPKALLTFVQRLADADALKRAAAVVGKRLERVEIATSISARRIALNRKHTDCGVAIADRHKQQRGRLSLFIAKHVEPDTFGL